MIEGQPLGPTPPRALPWGELERICPGRVEYGVPMSRLTTLRVGGPADALVTPASPEEVTRIIRWARMQGVLLLVVGGCSNLIVRDGGIRGLVLRVGQAMGEWRAEDQGERVRLWAQAGLPIRRLVREGVRGGWGSMEFLAGIPGCLGGAIAMNAGTRQGCLGDLLETVTWVDETGETVTKQRHALGLSYRRAAIPRGSVIVEATCLLPRKAPSEVREAVRQRMLQRRRSQPWGKPSAGSFFRNPPGDFAGRLIEQLGLKGLSRGGASVSEEHANFILNEGGATAADVLGLVGEIRDRVERRTGIRLQLEVQVVGEDRAGSG